MRLKNTGVVCMVSISDEEEGLRLVDLGNYFELNGKRVLVTSQEKAIKYGGQVDAPIYVLKEKNT